jgi:dipeptidase D
MTTAIAQLEPTPVWSHFCDLNAVPRPSKKEERVIEFMLAYGRSLGLPTRRDTTGNVIITKPATAGKEGSPVVVLQSHLDMVHQKNSDTEFDFDQEGIRMRIDGDWVRAEGTTLGSDNGIGVAMAMALLESTDIAHPALEALFTIDEETGMTGAKGFQGGELQGQILLNLDTEDDRELTIGCAGGVDIIAEGHYHPVPAPKEFLVYTIEVAGLTGGHSGMDIHLGRGNANKIMTRLLLALDRDFSLAIASVDGGGLRNAIPRESRAVFGAPKEESAALSCLFQTLVLAITEEYRTTDPDLRITLEQSASDTSLEVLPPDFQGRLLRALQALPNGIYRLSPDVAGLVQTSSNLARVLVGGRKVHAACLCRGSVDTEKMDMADAIRSALELSGLDVRFEGGYPGWAPRPESGIVRLMSQLYQETFGEPAHVNACHAGLECGILGTHYPDMEMISFGPNIRGAHSPDERVQISSVQKTWKLLLATLARL